MKNRIALMQKSLLESWYLDLGYLGRPGLGLATAAVGSLAGLELAAKPERAGLLCCHLGVAGLLEVPIEKGNAAEVAAGLLNVKGAGSTEDAAWGCVVSAGFEKREGTGVSCLLAGGTFPGCCAGSRRKGIGVSCLLAGGTFPSC